jgi:hypothetical protein
MCLKVCVVAFAPEKATVNCKCSHHVWHIVVKCYHICWTRETTILFWHAAKWNENMKCIRCGSLEDTFKQRYINLDWFLEKNEHCQECSHELDLKCRCIVLLAQYNELPFFSSSITLFLTRLLSMMSRTLCAIHNHRLIVMK